MLSGDAAGQRARGEFTVQVMADRYEALYAGTPQLVSTHHVAGVADIAANGSVVTSERLAESLAL